MRRPLGSNCFPSRPPCRPPDLAPCSPRCSLASSLRRHSARAPFGRWRRRHARKFGGRPLPANVALRHDRGGPRKVAQCKNRGKLKSVRATSGASRPLARTATTPDSKVTRPQASSKQCAGKRAASRGARRVAKRARAKHAEGAEGACQETDAEHWQRHSLVPRAERTVCCRCNFIKRRMAIKRDFPWCSPRHRFMGGHGP